MSQRRIPYGVALASRLMRGRVFNADLMSQAEFDLHRMRARKVLVVRTNQRLGNTLLASPSVEFANRAFPFAQVHFLAHRNTRTLLDGLGIARFHEFHREMLYKPWRLLSLLRSVESEAYDVIIDGGFGAKVDGLLVALASSPCKMGVRSSGRTTAYSRPIPMPPKRGHREQRWAHMASHMGIDMAPPRMRLNLTAMELRSARSWMDAHDLVPEREPIVMVFPAGRSRKGKRWPVEKYMETARLLAAAGVRIVIPLGPDERSMQSQIERMAPAGTVVLEPMPFRNVSAILAQCNLYVGADTGLMHAACALHVPALAVFLKNNWDRWGPLPDRGKVFGEAAARSPHELAAEAVAMLDTQKDSAFRLYALG
ncbi:MAG: hypothetical protein AMXMBFR84_23340 [Candidatus Hydrogenedentota bacterium]